MIKEVLLKKSQEIEYIHFVDVSEIILYTVCIKKTKRNYGVSLNLHVYLILFLSSNYKYKEQRLYAR